MKHSVMLMVFLVVALNSVFTQDEDFEDDSVKPAKKRRYLQDLPDKEVPNKEINATEKDEGGSPVSIEAYCICPRIYEPVCGSDGKTYNNKCTFDCENRKLLIDKKPGIAVVKEYPCEEEAEL